MEQSLSAIYRTSWSILLHRRSGVGKELAALVLAPYDGVRQKVLLTDNEPGQRCFYEELGFVRSTEFPGAQLNAFVRFD